MSFDTCSVMGCLHMCSHMLYVHMSASLLRCSGKKSPVSLQFHSSVSGFAQAVEAVKLFELFNNFKLFELQSFQAPFGLSSSSSWRHPHKKKSPAFVEASSKDQAVANGLFLCYNETWKRSFSNNSNTHRSRKRRRRVLLRKAPEKRLLKHDSLQRLARDRACGFDNPLCDSSLHPMSKHARSCNAPMTRQTGAEQFAAIRAPLHKIFPHMPFSMMWQSMLLTTNSSSCRDRFVTVGDLWRGSGNRLLSHCLYKAGGCFSLIRSVLLRGFCHTAEECHHPGNALNQKGWREDPNSYASFLEMGQNGETCAAAIWRERRKLCEKFSKRFFVRHMDRLMELVLQPRNGHHDVRTHGTCIPSRLAKNSLSPWTMYCMVAQNAPYRCSPYPAQCSSHSLGWEPVWLVAPNLLHALKVSPAPRTASDNLPEPAKTSESDLRSRGAKQSKEVGS